MIKTVSMPNIGISNFDILLCKFIAFSFVFIEEIFILIVAWQC